MRCTLATLFAAAFMLHWPTLARAQASDIQFRADYNETRNEADKKGVPIILYFTTDNCPWCVRLQRETFSDPAVAKVMNENFVPLKVHAVQEPRLVEILNIRVFPTVILAAPDGKIITTLEGFQEAPRFHESLQRVLTSVSNPDWMLRDYQIAMKAINDRDYTRGVALLKAIMEDGKGRPVQVNAGKLLKQVEQQAAGELAQAKTMVEKGKTNEASTLLTKLVKDYAGTQAAPEAANLLTSLAKSPQTRNTQRGVRARELLAQAKEDFRTEQWLCCLERCDLITSGFGDLPEAGEALQLALAIRGNPEWMQRTCDTMSYRLSEMYLGLAETWLQKGQTQQAILCLERVIRTFPGTRQAEQRNIGWLSSKGCPPIERLSQTWGCRNNLSVPQPHTSAD